MPKTKKSRSSNSSVPMVISGPRPSISPMIPSSEGVSGPLLHIGEAPNLVVEDELNGEASFFPVQFEAQDFGLLSPTDSSESDPPKPSGQDWVSFQDSFDGGGQKLKMKHSREDLSSTVFDPSKQDRQYASAFARKLEDSLTSSLIDMDPLAVNPILERERKEEAEERKRRQRDSIRALTQMVVSGKVPETFSASGGDDSLSALAEKARSPSPGLDSQVIGNGRSWSSQELPEKQSSASDPPSGWMTFGSSSDEDISFPVNFDSPGSGNVSQSNAGSLAEPSSITPSLKLRAPVKDQRKNGDVLLVHRRSKADVASKSSSKSPSGRDNEKSSQILRNSHKSPRTSRAEQTGKEVTRVKSHLGNSRLRGRSSSSKRPSRVLSVKAKNVRENSVEVHWVPPQAPDFDGFMCRRETSEGYVDKQVSSKTNGFRFAHLRSETRYLFRVAAIGGGGLSEFVTIQTGTAPPKPRVINATSLSGGVTVFEWELDAPVIGVDYAPRTKLSLYVRLSENGRHSKWFLVNDFGPSSTGTRIRRLKPGRGYQAGLVCFNRFGGSGSCTVTFSTPKAPLTIERSEAVDDKWTQFIRRVESPPTPRTPPRTSAKSENDHWVFVPADESKLKEAGATPTSLPELFGDPLGLNVVNLQTKRCTVQWTPDVACSTGSVTRLGLELVTGEAPKRLVSDRISPSHCSFICDDLVPATSYVVMLIGLASRGRRPEWKTIGSVPFTTPAVPEPVQSLKCVDAGTTALTMRWIPAPGAVGFFFCFRSGSQEPKYLRLTDPTQASEVICGLSAGLVYSVSCEQVHRCGNSDPVVVRAITAPAAPRSLRLVDCLAKSLKIQWNPPAMVEGGENAAIVRYSLHRRRRGKKWEVVSLIDPIDNPECEILRCEPSTAYTLAVSTHIEGHRVGAAAALDVVTLSLKAGRRIFHTREILHTQTSYVKQLNALKKYRILADESALFSFEERNLLFHPSLDRLVEENERFEMKLESALSAWRVDDPLPNCVDDLPSLSREHAEYIASYPKAEALLISLMSRDGVEDYLANGHTRLAFPLNSLLITPFQRLPRFVLMLREVMKGSDTNGSDFDRISSLIADLQSVIHKINDATVPSDDVSSSPRIPAARDKFLRKRTSSLTRFTLPEAVHSVPPVVVENVTPDGVVAVDEEEDIVAQLKRQAQLSSQEPIPEIVIEAEPPDAKDGEKWSGEKISNARPQLPVPSIADDDDSNERTTGYSEDEGDGDNANSYVMSRFVARYRFEACKPEELSLEENDLITTFYANGEWLYGEIDRNPGSYGWFPLSHVEAHDDSTMGEDEEPPLPPLEEARDDGELGDSEIHELFERHVGYELDITASPSFLEAVHSVALASPTTSASGSFETKETEEEDVEYFDYFQTDDVEFFDVFIDPDTGRKIGNLL